MRKTVIMLLAVCLFSLASIGETPARANAEEPIIIAFDEESIPYSFGTLKQIQGIYPDIVAAIFREIGQPVKIEGYPWKRVLMMLDEGQVGAAGIYKTEERMAKYDYSLPFFEERLQMFVLPGKEFAFSKVEDLAGKRIGVLAGWSHGDAFDKAREQKMFQVEEARKILPLIRSLEAGQIDAFIAIPESVKFLVDSEYSSAKLNVIEPPVIMNPVHIAFPKSMNKQEFIGKINAAIQKLQADGTIDTIVSTFKPRQ